MTAYERVDDVAPQAKDINCGPPGWGFTMWADQDIEPPHRGFLERLVQAHPDMDLALPDYRSDEDGILGTIKWADHEVQLYYEWILAYLSFWSGDRRAVEELRELVLPLVRSI
jgi:hypothetical protein